MRRLSSRRTRARQASRRRRRARRPVPPALKALVTELLPRLMHCCFQKNWQSTVGGVAGIDALSRVLPNLRASRAPSEDSACAAQRSAVAPRRTPSRRWRAATKLFHRVLETATPRVWTYAARTRPPASKPPSSFSPRNSSPRLRRHRPPRGGGCRDGPQQTKRPGREQGARRQTRARAGGLLARPLRSKHVNVQTQVVHIVNFFVHASLSRS